MRQITLVTDGACKGNPGPGGVGIILKDTDDKGEPRRREISQGYHYTTNGRMEIMAVIVGLEALEEPCEVTLIADAQFVVKAINGWLTKWEANRWRGSGNKAIKNVDLWQKVSQLRRIHTITAEWTRGHADDPDNIRCDKLASAAALGDNLLEDEGYFDGKEHFTTARLL